VEGHLASQWGGLGGRGDEKALEEELAGVV